MPFNAIGPIVQGSWRAMVFWHKIGTFPLYVKQQFETVMRQFFLLFFFVMLLPGGAAFAQFSIGYADFFTISASHPDVLQMGEVLKADEAKYAKEFGTMQQVFSDKFKEYERLGRANASDPRVAELEKELTAMQQELQTKADEYNEKLDAKREVLLEAFLQKFKAAATQVAKQYKVNCILQQVNNQGVSLVLTGPEEADLTAAIMQALNMPLTPEQKNRTVKFDPTSTRVAYTNIELVLSGWNQMQQAEEMVIKESDAMKLELRAKQAALSEKMNDYQQQIEGGKSTEEMTSLADEIRKEEAALDQMMQDLEVKLIKQREDLMAPVLDQAQKAMDKVAAERGYTYTINQTTSGGLSTILYGPEEADLTKPLAKELGVQGMGDDAQQQVAGKGVKIGLVGDVADMIMALPAYAAAEKELEQYSRTETEKAQARFNYASETITQKKEQMQGTLTLEQRMALENEITDLKREIEDLEGNLSLDISSKQSELYAPLLEKVQGAIDAVAKEGGYTYVLNQLDGITVIYIDEQHDLSKKIQSKL